MEYFYIRLQELKPELAKETLIVNYGETGRRNNGLGYAIEATIQLISAESNNPIYPCKTEGQGETEVNDIRLAINRYLTPYFPNKINAVFPTSWQGLTAL